jgi:hypothetical protein
MGGHPPEADWELVVGRDLVAHLLPAGRLCGVRRPGDVAWLPDGAYQALVDSVGHVSLEDLLVVPAVAWPAERWRRRWLYSPLCVMAIGERGVGLWVQALPAPGVRAWVPFEEIAAVGQRADGRRGVLAVTAPADTLVVRYNADGQAVVDAWARRLRLRAAAAPGGHGDGKRQ